MFGGGGMNPRKLEQMMNQMGIDVQDLDATEAIIRLEDGTELVFESPDVTRMDAQGQQTYQIVGKPTEREADADDSASEAESDEPELEDSGDDDIPESDVQLVRERTGASEAEAREALAATNGDLAAAISRLE